MSATIADIAKIAKVSRSTAGALLAGRVDQLRIARRTRQKVLSVAEDLDYPALVFRPGLGQS